MGDDGYSASELRRRYNKGGTLQDNDLSAAQLRARHNVKGRDFADGGGGTSPVVMIAGGVAVCLVIAGIVYFAS